MNRFFTLLLAVSCLTAVGQVTYPYNPDGNADGDIAVGDLQDFLVTYGNPFSPSEIMVGDSSLTTVLANLLSSIEGLQQVISDQQSTIDELQEDLSSSQSSQGHPNVVFLSQIPIDSVLVEYTYVDFYSGDSITYSSYPKFLDIPDTMELLVVDENPNAVLCLNPNASRYFSIVGTNHDGHYYPYMRIEPNYSPCGSNPRLDWLYNGSSFYNTDWDQSQTRQGIITVRYIESIGRWFYEM